MEVGWSYVPDSRPADGGVSGNTGTDLETGEPIVFDASAMYAHNECESLNPWSSGETSGWLLNTQDELRTMRANRRFFGRSYLKSYHECYSISEPVEELDARLALYGM